tara:strand:- start:1813 stop:3024 length:1212 start_codon:yes stop_codon:yes gene_type:complete
MKKDINYKSIIFALIPLVLMGPLAMDMYLPALSSIKTSMNTTGDLVQWTLSIFVFGFGFCQLIVGAVVGYLGRNKTLFIALLLYLTATLSCAMTDNIYVLILFRFIQALGACGCMVLSMAIVRELVNTEKDSTKAYTFLSGCTALAPILAPIFGALILELLLSWRFIFYFLGMFSLLGLLLFGLKISKLEKALKSDHSIAPLKYSLVINNLDFWSYAVLGAAGMTCLFTFFSLSPFILVERYNLIPKEFSIAFGLCAFIFLIGSILGPKIVEKLKLDSTLALSFLTIATTGLLMAFMPLNYQTLRLFIILMMIVNFWLGISFGLCMAGAMKHFKYNADKAASVYGFQQFIIAFSIGTLVVLSGFKTQAALGITIFCVSFTALTLNFLIKNIKSNRGLSYAVSN